MGDLVSRKETEKLLRAYADEVGCNRGEYELANGILKAVCYLDNIPTAFDLESVIVEIEQIATDNSCKDCKYRDKCDELQEFYNPADDVDLCALTTKYLALEILKSATNATNGKIGG